MKGRFITVSGLDHSGKTTLLNGLQQYLEGKGVKVTRVREPGGTPAGEVLRKIIIGQYVPSLEKLSSKTELLLFYANRSQVIDNVIKPALLRGDWVLADRFDFDSMAYQGCGLGLLDEVITLSDMVCGDLIPDLRLLLDITVPVMRERAKLVGELDDIETRGDDFFNAARKGFLLAHELETPRWHKSKLLNGCADKETVLKCARFAIDELLEGGA